MYFSQVDHFALTSPMYKNMYSCAKIIYIQHIYIYMYVHKCWATPSVLCGSILHVLFNLFLYLYSFLFMVTFPPLLLYTTVSNVLLRHVIMLSHTRVYLLRQSPRYQHETISRSPARIPRYIYVHIVIHILCLPKEFSILISL